MNHLESSKPYGKLPQSIETKYSWLLETLPALNGRSRGPDMVSHMVEILQGKLRLDHNYEG